MTLGSNPRKELKQKLENLENNRVTRFGDLLDFGQLFKAIGNN